MSLVMADPVVSEPVTAGAICRAFGGTLQTKIHVRRSPILAAAEAWSRRMRGPVSQVLLGIGAGAAVAAGAVALVLLLPIILVAAPISIARSERRLANTRCVACGQPIGLSEIHRARDEALREAWAGYDPALGIRRRIAPVWRIVCPSCGHRYWYRSTAARAVLVSEDPGAVARD
jgi:hypothetical protein